MHQVLFVAYFFPPAGGAGVQRSLKFVKYLPQNGWQPTVLTVSPQHHRITDPTLAAEIPPGVTVHRTPAWLLPKRLPFRLRHALTRWLLVVDEQIGWLPFAVRRARSLLQSQNFHAVYTTSAPYTDHLIGLRLKRATGLPWVADFRDPWVDNFSASFATPLHEMLARHLERQITTTADRVIVVSEPMRQALLQRYSLPPEKVLVITNGFDPADFNGIQPAERPAQRWNIVYSGSFYGSKQTPRHFFEGIRAALDRKEIPDQSINIRLVGSFSPQLQKMAKDTGVADLLEITGYLPHRQSLSAVLAADVLLLVVGAATGSEAVFTGKIFEYLAARRPILALAPAGAAADLVREARAGLVVPPEDVDAIREQIVALYQQWQRGQATFAPDETVIARYDRRALTAQLAAVLDEVCP